jgi:hypothetical protein
MPAYFKHGRVGFPHRVEEVPKTGRRRYVIESRLITTLNGQLCVYPGTPLERWATEDELPVNGPVYFNMVPCLATNRTDPLNADMFKPGVPDNWFTPQIKATDKQAMKSGQLEWKFKPNFLSSNFKYTPQEVCFRITCLDHGLTEHKLTVFSEGVLIVAREQRKRDREDAAA